ncbi:MAG: flagellar basal body rod modification protein [Roseovarius sp.]|nr:flagellar basal body rod modification protein [Roseovarius sp.]MBK44355.1 flagellar basal body rod modification protein [Roseovarius sp.]
MEPVTAAPPAAAQATPGAPPAAAGSGALGPDFETFLRMLTTQMRNQDPLDPVDSADFAVQLATFSSVEQQVLTNDLLTGLGAQMATLGMGQLAGWIGLEAEVDAPVRFAGAPVTLGTTVDPAAETAELVVTDEQGVIVQRVAIPPQGGPVPWQGRDALGLPLRAGTYRITADSQAGGKTIARHEVHLHARIEEARLENGTVQLVLETGQSVDAREVLGLRPPPAP